MYLLDIIPLTKIPNALPQVLSYFSSQVLPAGALVQVPLGRRKENGIVIGTRDIASSKMEIKSANFELRNISKIISADPVLTAKQIELALFLGQYYFCSPGIFAKMCLPKTINNKKNSSTKNYQLKTKNCRLILVPTVSRAHSSYKSYLSDNTILWHSELTQKQKNSAWLAIKTGQAQAIVGTRSAVFLPFNNLKEIVIEDETNPNHKSWDMFPHYDSRLIAQKLTESFNAHLSLRAPLERGEAIPPALRQRLRLGERTTEKTPDRHGDSALKSPRDDKMHIIDMRAELKGGNFSIFSVDLYEAVKNAIDAKKQVILFINRRGLSNFILCRDCGYIAKCPNCDSPMAHHLINNKPSLLCHHCGTKETSPKICPKCKSWRIKTVGSGSQKVEAETQKFFPDAKILRLDGDIAPKPKDQQKIITDFTEKKADILIATQTIFSWLAELATDSPAVVGILSADTLLHIPDFRSSERTLQTIRALQSLQNNAPSPATAGLPPLNLRGGEGELSAPLMQRGVGGFFIQTYNPENSVLKYLRDNDYDGFKKEDAETRQALNYPPFSQIVKLTFRHRDANKAGQEAKILAAKLNDLISSSPQTRGGLRWGDENNIELSPALPAFLPRERGKFVWNIIVKFLPPASAPLTQRGVGGGKKDYTSPAFLRLRNSLLQYVPQNWEIDVDPENLL